MTGPATTSSPQADDLGRAARLLNDLQSRLGALSVQIRTTPDVLARTDPQGALAAIAAAASQLDEALELVDDARFGGVPLTPGETLPIRGV